MTKTDILQLAATGDLVALKAELRKTPSYGRYACYYPPPDLKVSIWKTPHAYFLICMRQPHTSTNFLISLLNSRTNCVREDNQAISYTLSCFWRIFIYHAKHGHIPRGQLQGVVEALIKANNLSNVIFTSLLGQLARHFQPPTVFWVDQLLTSSQYAYRLRQDYFPPILLALHVFKPKFALRHIKMLLFNFPTQHYPCISYIWQHFGTCSLLSPEAQSSMAKLELSHHEILQMETQRHKNNSMI